MPVKTFTNTQVRECVRAYFDSTDFRSELGHLHFKVGYAIHQTAAKMRRHLDGLGEYELELDKKYRTKVVKVPMTGPDGKPQLDADGKPVTFERHDFPDADSRREHAYAVQSVMNEEVEIEVHEFDAKYLEEADEVPGDLFLFSACIKE